ncbi:MAG: class I SAM-dependent methyltransferase [Methanoregula sp.]|nr:class I SAM-dependent methyltransferase [Methanoregula sp.]
MGVNSYPWHIGSLPFVFKPLLEPSNGGDIPDFLPFSLDIDKKTGTLIQSKNKYVEKILSKAYLTGSEISGMMDDHGIGELYAQDFIKFLNKTLKTDNFKNLKILEIGCGTGYLLYQLKNRGADVIGIEPGLQGQIGAERFKIPIVRDFFPSSKITGKFDIIILYAFLEHIPDISQFFKEVMKYLNQNGKMFISVPDCEPYIKTGDLSFIFHEHWSFFTSDTLQNSITLSTKLAGDIKKSHFGGLLYASILSNDLKKQPDDNAIESQKILAKQFQILAQNDLEKITDFFKSATQHKYTMGVFVPGRAINILSLIKSRIDLPKLRFFDDNPVLYRTYYPGFNVPIENRQELVRDPPELLIIFTHSFGEKIKRELGDSLKDLRIITWDDLFINQNVNDINLISKKE